MIIRFTLLVTLFFSTNCILTTLINRATNSISPVNFLLLALGGGSPSSAVSAENGGEVVLPSNQESTTSNLNPVEVTLSISADALEEDTQVTISRIEAPPPIDGISPISSSYRFLPEDTQFLKPVNAEFCYDPNDLIKKGLTEDSVKIYYLDEVTNQLANIGGTVDKSRHCVEGQIEHFSVYLPAATAAISSNTAPLIGAPTFIPSTPLAGFPLTFRSIITDQQVGQIGSIISASLYYRIAGSAAVFQKISLSPDTFDGSAERFQATIPANYVTLAGIEYYLEAYDNLGFKRSRPATAPVAYSTKTITLNVDSSAPLRLSPTANPVKMSAGFSRDFTLQVKRAGANTFYNAIPSTFSYSVTTNSHSTTTPPSSPYDQVTQIATSTLRLAAGSLGSGLITVGSGSTITNRAIEIHPGFLSSISFLDLNGIKILGPLHVSATTSYSLDILGYDSFGNHVLVKPSFSIYGGIGTISGAAIFTATNVNPISGQIIADLAGIQSSITVNITAPPPAEVPVFSPPGGHYNTPQYITISSLTSGATIYFTTDGTTPTSVSSVFTTPIHIWSVAGKTIKTYASKSGLSDSAVVSGVYSYPPLKTGAGSIAGYTLLNGEDGLTQNGVARSYTGPVQDATYAADYTTLDNATGLMWKTCSQGQSGYDCGTGSSIKLTWQDAAIDSSFGCSSLNLANSGAGYAGKKNWRLPTMRDLATIVDYGKLLPSINRNAFPATDSDYYWSSDSITFNTLLLARSTNFYSGIHNNSIIDQSAPIYSSVRCVTSK